MIRFSHIVFSFLLIMGSAAELSDIKLVQAVDPAPKKFVVTATIYSVDTISYTASGRIIDSLSYEKFNLIAISRDLKSHFSLGDKVRIIGADSYDGIYLIDDFMHKRWRSRIDILVGSTAALNKFHNVLIEKL